MSSAYFETECIRTHPSTYKTDYTDACKTHYTLPVYTSYNLLPEGEPSGLKHVEYIKNI